jgi:DMSO/TMAO reductase YedYZ molybdopterin-dependent catalytic subunit
MRKIESSHFWFMFSVLATATFLISCSHIPSTPSPKLPAKSTESTPAPTPNGGLPVILTYKDLSILIDNDPAQIDNSSFPITPVESLGITGSPPNVDLANYTLSVDGLVNNPLALSYDAILQYPAVSEVVLLICPGSFVDNAKWTGVLVTTLLTEAGIKTEASQVIFHALDRYERTFSLQDSQQDGVFLAYAVNDQILPKEHGYPVRLVAKGKYGSDWVKWVNHIEIK